MKNIFKILAIAFIGMGLVSCEKDEDQAILNETSQSSISADKTTIVLDKNNVDVTAVNFKWAKSTFNLSIVSTQQIEFGMKGKNFQDSKLIDVVSSPFSMTNKQLNALILGLGGTANVVNEIEVRLMTAVGGAKFYSNVIKLQVTPYILGPVYNYTDLFLIGDATAGGWDNVATNTKLYPLQKSATAGKYSYTGYFAKGGIKLIKHLDHGTSNMEWEQQEHWTQVALREIFR
ncbi:SusE domain-containing protein [Chryseobacterium tructae]|uniref:SusE domain-containing protein n=1 Tax=Chryseobacterium tructae TaxID=1037380 RepID=UPI0025B5EF1C|nr:SusE domain-containing protein [Chryseobacterium tructae]MDN3693911.1 SusE domain-containing protein [Chryseobacterium tructae]